MEMAGRFDHGRELCSEKFTTTITEPNFEYDRRYKHSEPRTRAQMVQFAKNLYTTRLNAGGKQSCIDVIGCICIESWGGIVSLGGMHSVRLPIIAII